MTTCQCGEPYAATTDGRQRHRLIFEHTPVVQTPVVKPDKATARKCSHGYHKDCGGGLLHRGEPTACDCRCHGGAA